jgi:sugar phosphate permease
MSASTAAGSRDARWLVLGTLAIGYVGVYLSRKNLAVAVPLLQSAFEASKAEVGRIASFGTLAYAVGKLVSGPLVDRIGGRAGFIAALAGVAIFGGLGAFAPTITVLMLVYGVNRFFGAGGWGAMVKLVPTWFGPRRAATVIGVLSLSYVAGGVAATLLARAVVLRGGGWRAVFGVPSLVVLAIAFVCFLVVRRGPIIWRTASAESREAAVAYGVALRELFKRRQFIVACAVSFTVTLMREAFNNWNVDFLTSVQTGPKSVGAAALQSIGFDVAGAVGILVAGIAYDRMHASNRRWLMVGTLALLAVVLAALPYVATKHPLAGMWFVAAVGLLVYGPFSLLSGVIAVETGGERLAATAAGVIDGVGYLAGVLSGAALGGLLDVGGYRLGFGCLAGITAVAAIVAVFFESSKV